MKKTSWGFAVALGILILSMVGSAIVGLASGATSSSKSRQHVRVGKIHDADTTAGDGQFNFAEGRARCKRGERLVAGGPRRIHSDALFPGLRWAVQESNPVPNAREWKVSAASDLGGLARKDFVVIAVCESR